MLFFPVLRRRRRCECVGILRPPLLTTLVRPLPFGAIRILRKEQWTTSRPAKAHRRRRPLRTLSTLAGNQDIGRDASSACPVLPRSSLPKSKRHKARGIRHAVSFSTSPRLLSLPTIYHAVQQPAHYSQTSAFATESIRD